MIIMHMYIYIYVYDHPEVDRMWDFELYIYITLF